MPFIGTYQNLVSAMQPLLDDVSGEMALSQHIAGDDRGVNHYVVESYKSYADFMKAQNTLMQSP